MTQVHLSGRLICETMDQADIIRRYLPDHIRLTRAEAGCLAFDVVQSADPLIWTVTESFVDEAAFAVHQTRTRASDWWKATTKIAREFQITGLNAPDAAPHA
jgi:quinol monooxygenase YgiN